jgi:hypothetical protein
LKPTCFPPSRDDGLNTHHNTVKTSEEKGVAFIKSEDGWNEYQKMKYSEADINKDNYVRRIGWINE